MDTNDEWVNKLPTWVVVVVGIALGGFVLWSINTRYQLVSALRANPRYTIGYVTGTSYASSSSSHSIAFFSYTVGDSTYRTSASGDLVAGCTRCLVKYAASDPQKIAFYNQVCVPDSITEVPKRGWQKPPFAVPSSVE